MQNEEEWKNNNSSSSGIFDEWDHGRLYEYGVKYFGYKIYGAVGGGYRCNTCKYGGLWLHVIDKSISLFFNKLKDHMFKYNRLILPNPLGIIEVYRKQYIKTGRKKKSSLAREAGYDNFGVIERTPYDYLVTKYKHVRHRTNAHPYSASFDFIPNENLRYNILKGHKRKEMKKIKDRFKKETNFDVHFPFEYYK